MFSKLRKAMSEFLSLFHSVISQALARRGADRRHSDATTTASWSFAFISLYTPRSHHRVRSRVARNNRATVFSLSLSLSLSSLSSQSVTSHAHTNHTVNVQRRFQVGLTATTTSQADRSLFFNRTVQRTSFSLSLTKSESKFAVVSSAVF